MLPDGVMPPKVRAKMACEHVTHARQGTHHKPLNVRRKTKIETLFRGNLRRDFVQR
jgi:hypothetical protein